MIHYFPPPAAPAFRPVPGLPPHGSPAGAGNRGRRAGNRMHDRMLIILLFSATAAVAQGEIRYDPEKGIMFIDKKDSSGKAGVARPLVSIEKKKGEEKTAGPQTPPQVPLVRIRDSTDLQVGRKKDPPTLYFISGLEYFKNGDYSHAFRNFSYADSVDPKPVYHLWAGKTMRQLGKPQNMLKIMYDIIKKNVDCDVADDALFEMAAYYQSIDDYATASRLYTQIAEQYPFGESYSTGEKYIDIVREQRKLMNAEISNMLATLGFTGDDLAENYRVFQKSHRLPETGRGDPETVRTIKKLYQKMLDREKQKEKIANQSKHYLLWAGIAGSAGLLIVLLSIGLLLRTRGRSRHLDEVAENLADLDVRKL